VGTSIFIPEYDRIEIDLSLKKSVISYLLYDGGDEIFKLPKYDARGFFAPLVILNLSVSK